MSLNIAEELEKMSKEHFENGDAKVSIKKKGKETRVKISGDTATVLTLLTDAVATVLSNCFGRDEFFINMMADEFCKNIKELAKEKNNDRS